MESYFPPSGRLSEHDFAAILFQTYSQAMNGILKIIGRDYVKTLQIENQKIQFASSTLPGENLGSFLRQRNIISESVMNESTALMKTRSIRHGRALLEMGVFTPERLWDSVILHQKELLFPLFAETAGDFDFQINSEPHCENIVLNLSIPQVMIDGIRQLADTGVVTTAIDAIAEFYVRLSEIPFQIKLKPFEIHIFDMVKRHCRRDEIIKRSELLPTETRKILYLLLRLQVIGDCPPVSDSAPAEGPKPKPVFNSYEDCLNHYNSRFVYIYRVLSKEIGPVALSILFAAVTEILESIPPYFANVEFLPGGGIVPRSILKSLWYLNFSDNINEFLRGLEEILYAQIYAVKKHLGREYEQQILQWMRENGD
jgi:hypothetical protein